MIKFEFQRHSILPEIGTLKYYPVDVQKWIGLGSSSNREAGILEEEDRDSIFTEAASRMPQSINTILRAVKRTARRLRITDDDLIAMAFCSVIIDVDRMKLPNATGPLLNTLAKYRIFDARRKEQQITRKFRHVIDELMDVRTLHAKCNETIDGIRMLDRLLTLIPLKDDGHRKAAILRAAPLCKDEQAQILGISRCTAWRWEKHDVPILLRTVKLIPSLPMWSMLDLFVFEGLTDSQTGLKLGLSARRVDLIRRYAKKLIKERITGAAD